MILRSLTPLIAHKHRACSVPRAVVSLPAWKQVIPEHRCTLEFKKQTKVDQNWCNQDILFQKHKHKPSLALLLLLLLGRLWLPLLPHHSSTEEKC